MRYSKRDAYNRERELRSGCMVLILLVLVIGCGPDPSADRSSREAIAGGIGSTMTGAESRISQTVTATHATQSHPDRDMASSRSGSLVVPTWLANDLASSNVQVKLQALDRWAQSAPVGSVDLLMLALEDQDEAVQSRALALLEEDWRQAQEEER
jgi:hypothetical protein